MHTVCFLSFFFFFSHGVCVVVKCKALSKRFEMFDMGPRAVSLSISPCRSVDVRKRSELAQIHQSLVKRKRAGSKTAHDGVYRMEDLCI